MSVSVLLQGLDHNNRQRLAADFITRKDQDWVAAMAPVMAFFSRNSASDGAVSLSEDKHYQTIFSSLMDVAKVLKQNSPEMLPNLERFGLFLHNEDRPELGHALTEASRKSPALTITFIRLLNVNPGLFFTNASTWAASPRHRPEAAMISKPTVVILEDDPNVAEHLGLFWDSVIEERFGKGNVDVVVKDSIESATEALGTLNTILIVSDTENNKGRNGPNGQRWVHFVRDGIKSGLIKAPVIPTSGNADAVLTKSEWLQAGVPIENYLQKPYGIPQISQALEPVSTHIQKQIDEFKARSAQPPTTPATPAMSSVMSPEFIQQALQRDLYVTNLRLINGVPATTTQWKNIVDDTLTILASDDPEIISRIYRYTGYDPDEIHQGVLDRRLKALKYNLIKSVAEFVRDLRYKGEDGQVVLNDSESWIHGSTILTRKDFKITRNSFISDLMYGDRGTNRELFFRVINFLNVANLLAANHDPHAVKFNETLSHPSGPGFNRIDLANAERAWRGELPNESMSAQRSVLPQNNVNQLGGIDFNAANMNLLVKRDGRGVPLPLVQQDMGQLSRIQGFIPEIIEIKPAVNVPILSELQQKLQST
jgi:hypothetical protein